MIDRDRSNEKASTGSSAEHSVSTTASSSSSHYYLFLLAKQTTYYLPIHSPATCPCSYYLPASTPFLPAACLRTFARQDTCQSGHLPLGSWRYFNGFHFAQNHSFQILMISSVMGGLQQLYFMSLLHGYIILYGAVIHEKKG